MCKYNIIRFYKDHYPNKRVIARGLTLDEAQAHCQDPETSSSTCKKYTNRKRTERLGAWFDGYSEH